MNGRSACLEKSNGTIPMLWFFLIASLMVVAAITFLALPVLRTGSAAVDQRDRQNIAMARERLSQLETQVETGSVDSIQAEQEKSEIELGLLDDVDLTSGEPDVIQNQKGIWAGVVVAVCTPFLAGMLYLVLGQPSAFIQGENEKMPGTNQTDGGAEVDVDAMVRRLEQKLAQSPDDAEGWYMLGTSYMVLQRYGDAASVFEKLTELVGDEPDLLVRQADALAMAGNGVLAGEPENLLLRALAADPNHPVALWMVGIVADRRGDTEEALHYWERAEPLFGDSPQSQAELQAMIEGARSRLAAGTGSPEASGGQDTVSETAEPDAASGNSITVRVSLDVSLSGEIAGSDTLFVLARAVDGPAMPLAVVRKRADELPLVVTLDDSMAMMPTMKLSSREQVTVVAKVSRSGNAITQSGDLIGEMSPVIPGDQNLVNVVISKIAP